MTSYNDLINELSEICGIVPEYWDVFGVRHITPVETKKAILRAMKLNIDSDGEMEMELDERRGRPWNRFLGPVKVVSVNDQPVVVPVYVPVDTGEEGRLSISLTIENEEGGKESILLAGDEIVVSDQRLIDGIRYVRVDIKDLRTRNYGYYNFDVVCRHPEKVFQGRCRVIVTPDECYLGPRTGGAAGGPRPWGLSVNLYSVRSSTNWGTGDFADLNRIVEWVAGLTGCFVGVNPLHATENKKPFGISPYSPISRLYRNFIYLDVENIPEALESAEVRALMEADDFRETLAGLRNADLIDYEKAAALKMRVLRCAFDYFYEQTASAGSAGPESRLKAFHAYISEEGAILDAFATFMALSEFFKGQGYGSWGNWPEEYLDPAGRAVEEFRVSNEKKLLFYKYIQWLIDVRLGETARLAGERGMSIGLYHDLAIGSIGGGSDAWNYQDVVTGGMDVGAPPDDFNITGQNWGFPPMVPERLKETGYDFFIQTIRKNMKYGGALRIDHALGLFRLFWIPEGMPAAHGAYVEFPHEDLLRIIALESVRNRTMIIAEDLGTIGENVRETLHRFKMLSYRLLYFERNYPDPSFAPPEKYPEMALCSVTTHDLPTVSGFWSGRDIEMKRRLGIYSDDGLRLRHLSERERDKALLIDALRARGIIGEGRTASGQALPAVTVMSPELCLAIYEYLCRSSCRLVTVSLDDVIGTLDQQNMPGITDSYPSWMQRTPVALERILSGNWFALFAERLKALYG